MASRSEVDQALWQLVERLRQVDPALRGRLVVERTLSCHASDLGLVWSARLCDQGLVEVRVQDADQVPDGERAQVRLHATSDDLVALAEGRLAPSAAWASNRLGVKASVLDLLRLRALL